MRAVLVAALLQVPLVLGLSGSRSARTAATPIHGEPRSAWLRCAAAGLVATSHADAARAVFDTRSAGGLSKKWADTGVVRKENAAAVPAGDGGSFARQKGGSGSADSGGLGESLGAPADATRIVAELVAPSGRGLRVAFDSPWPETGTRGVEARDLRTGDSAFVVVAPRVNKGAPPLSSSSSDPAAAAAEAAALSSVFSPAGKYGAYGAPFDVKVRSRAPLPLPSAAASGGAAAGGEEGLLLDVTFTALTPAQREVERRALIAIRALDGEGAFALLVSGCTQARWKVAESDVRAAVMSFRARLL